MSEFFKEEDVQKQYIPPDYGPSEEGDSDDEDVLDDIEDEVNEEEDEGKTETILDENERTKSEEKENNNNTARMITGSGFGTPAPTSGGWNPPTFGSGPSQQSSPFGGSSGSIWSQPSRPSWGSSPSGGSIWGGQQRSTEQTQINREKKIIFCDFLDCIVETWDSQGKPGYLPRDIYDLKARFEVWSKIQAFNPNTVYALIPINLIPNTNGAQGWVKTLEYFCCCLAAYLRIPESNCKILAQTAIGQPKEELINSILNGPVNINRSDAIYIGIYSGLAGQSNRDQVAAERCNIDYVDLGILLNNMY